MTFKEKIKFLVSDIRFWIIVFFVIRLFGITNAPLEMGHNWRQSLTNMITRNFYEGGVDMFHPRIDMSGFQTGIIGSEFPFYNYLTYLFSSIFRYEHWHGRLINLIISSVGMYFFYLLLEKISSKRIAFNSTIILLASIWFGFSRKSMPDTFSISLIIIGLYYCYMYLVSGKIGKLFLFFIFATLGMLCKIPALSLMSLIPLILIAKEIPFNRKLTVFVFSGISIGIVFTWYFYWVPYLVKTYNYELFYTKSLSEGLKEIQPLWGDYFGQFYKTALRSYVALVFLIIGIVVIIKSKLKYLKIGVLLISVVFFLFTLKTGAVFPLHSYYIIPFVPIMAVIVGYGLEKIPTQYQAFFLIIISIESIANQHHDFIIKNSEKYKLKIEYTLDKYIKKNELIVINAGPNPQEIYFTHRKGWSIDNRFFNKKSLDSLHLLGASFAIINKAINTETLTIYPKVFSDKNYDIYKLKK